MRSRPTRTNGSLVGRKFGRLLVTGVYPERAENRAQLLECVCDCGEHKIVLRPNLLSGNTKSCGCLQRELAAAHLRRVRKPKRATSA
jgi:hypothetical protein